MQQNMQLRIMTVKLKLETIEDAIRAWPKYVPNFAGRGLVAQFTGVNRETGDLRSVTIWESKEILKSNEGRADIVNQLASFDVYYADKPVWTYFDLTSSYVDVGKWPAIAAPNDKNEVWYYSYER
ncbi:MAG: hypothetical protein AB1440_21780 [Pseudomonadota bacterium]|jgi:hypothetical protein